MTWLWWCVAAVAAGGLFCWILFSVNPQEEEQQESRRRSWNGGRDFES